MPRLSEPRFHWDAVDGWVVDTQFAMTETMLLACIRHVRKVQGDRIRAMPPGDRKDQARRALASLSTATVRQNILPRQPWDRDRIIY